MYLKRGILRGSIWLKSIHNNIKLKNSYKMLLTQWKHVDYHQMKKKSHGSVLHYFPCIYIFWWTFKPIKVLMKTKF